jgi:DNA repair protein RadD
MDRWAHQIRGVAEVLDAIAAGEKRLALTSPTGMGKSIGVCDIIERLVAEDWYAVLYSNRRLMVDQLITVLAQAGIKCGVRASGHEAERDLPVQISSLPTERARTLKSEQWTPHGEGRKCLAVVDEAHLNATGTALEMLEWHWSRGHVSLSVTATPLGIGNIATKLIVAGTNSEGRQCGALVPAIHYGCDEPDLRTLKVAIGEEVSQSKQRSAIMTPTIWGRVIEQFRRLNPEERPTLLFGPDVAGSKWFAEQFSRAGISAAHIDGESVWWNGETYRRVRGDNDPAKDMLQASKEGRLKVICNRFVMREGIDAPWLSHLIFACIMGGVGTYLQAGGRLLRAYPGLKEVTVQDHGGHYWRHGSLNGDRQWFLEYTPQIASGLREDRLRGKLCGRCKVKLTPGFPVCKACGFLNEIEPIVCPECSRILNFWRCPCGWEAPPKWKPSRKVVQIDGTLKEMTGDVFKPHNVMKQLRGPALWERMYYRAKSTKWNATFRQAFALFARDNYFQWPDRNWPLMPVRDIDQYKHVADVPYDRLIPKGA